MDIITLFKCVDAAIKKHARWLWPTTAYPKTRLIAPGRINDLGTFANAVAQEDGSRECTLERAKSMYPQFVVKREGHVKNIRWMWCMVEINWIVEQAQAVTAAT